MDEREAYDYIRSYGTPSYYGNTFVTVTLLKPTMLCAGEISRHDSRFDGNFLSTTGDLSSTSLPF